MASPSLEGEQFTAISPADFINVISGSTLLRQETEKVAAQQYGDGLVKTGVKSVDAQFPDLFRGGCAIGIGDVGDGGGVNNLSIHLLASALWPPMSATAAAAEPSQQEAEVFILAPPNTSSTIIGDLHSLLQLRLSSRNHSTNSGAEDAAVRLLDNVRVLQYLDLTGLAEGVSEVSQTLSDREGVKRKTTTILVKGLSNTLGLAQRRSGSVQVASMVSNLLRTLNYLSRTFRTLVLVDYTVSIGRNEGNGGEGGGGGKLDSAFAGEKGEVMEIMPGAVVGEVLQNGLDVFVVVHDGFGKARKVKAAAEGVKTRIVEVVKDRVGDRIGEWCIWVQ